MRCLDHNRFKRTLWIVWLAAAAHGFAPEWASAQLTLEIRDYAVMPITGLVDGTGNNDAMLARINGLHEEPGGADRFFVHDLNGPLYILNKETKTVTTYLDFNGREGRTGLFQKLFFEAGYGCGLAAFYFDPDYRKNGK